MTTLITGAGGFIAQHLTTTLRSSGAARLVGVDLRPGSASQRFDAFETADLTDAAAVREIVSRVRPSVVYHLVGLIRGTDEAIIASNLGTARNLLSALRRSAPMARVVLIGSAAEYGAVPVAAQPVREDYAGEPTGPYGRVKQQLSALAREAAGQGQPVMLARPFNVIGAGVPDSLVAGAIVHRLRTALRGDPPYAITIGRTSSVRDFVASEDVAAGLVRIAERGRPGEAYNLCSGEGHAISEVVDHLLAAAAVPVRVDRDETLMRGGDVDVIVGSRTKAETELGWAPRVSFAESLAASWRGESSQP
jgi:GDP-4-dehydro-6-deoxy-D-mannose reductase